MPKWSQWLTDDDDEQRIETFQPIKKHKPSFSDDPESKESHKKKFKKRVPKPDKE